MQFDENLRMSISEASVVGAGSACSSDSTASSCGGWPASAPLASAPISRPLGGCNSILDHELGVSSARLYAQMREIENEGLIYDPKASYLKVRRVLVDFICECGEEHRLNNSTVHVAVGYLDKILQKADLRRDRYYLVAVSCLIIAAKYEEKEEGFVPSAERMLGYLRLRGHSNEFSTPSFVHQTEVTILTMLNWGLTIVTPLHYLGLYQKMGLIFNSDTMGYEPLVPKVLEYMKRYTDFFADLCLQEYAFRQYPPSLTAAAIVLAARKAINVRPLWTPQLEFVLNYSEQEILLPFQQVWDTYSVHFPDDARINLRREKASDRKLMQMADKNAEGNMITSPAPSAPGGGVRSEWNEMISPSAMGISTPAPLSNMSRSTIGSNASEITGNPLSESDNTSDISLFSPLSGRDMVASAGGGGGGGGGGGRQLSFEDGEVQTGSAVTAAAEVIQ